MAIFHLCLHDRVSRGAGQSSLASAAYIDREAYVDSRTGEVFDYTRLRAPLFMGMYAPKDAPDWAREAQQLWNRVESFEKRCDAQLAIPLDIALPHELTLEQNRYLLQDFVRENFTRKGYAAQVAIHPPDHDQRNIHAHVLVTLRTIGPDGFARTKAEQQENYRNRAAYTEGLRESWEKLANRHLERHGFDVRIDRRTLREQGAAREPTSHLGPTAAAAMFDRADRRELHAAETELKAVMAEIVDLAAARARRERQDGVRDAWIAETERQRPMTLMEERVAAAFVASQQVASDMLTRFGRPLTSEECAAGLAQMGIHLARVSADDLRVLELERAVLAGDDRRFVPQVSEGELVAVDDIGRVHRLSANRLDLGSIEQALGGGQTPSVASAREAAAADRAERQAPNGSASDEKGEGFAAPAGERLDIRDPGDIAGRIADGALKLLGGVFEFFFSSKPAPAPKPDPEEDYRRWAAAEAAKRARDELLHRRPSEEREHPEPGDRDDVEEERGYNGEIVRRPGRGRRRSR